MAQDVFNRLGHVGRWNKTLTVTASAVGSGSTKWFTGSNYGVSGVLRGTSAEGTLFLSVGGSIDITDLDAGVVHYLGVEHVEGVNSGSMYFLSRG